MKKLGCLCDKEDKRDWLYTETFRAITPPPEVDYSKEMNPIRRQGGKSSCVAFACCAVREWQEAAQRDLSEEFLYDHIQVDGGGSYPRDAMKVLQKIGVCLEEQFPYRKEPDSVKLSPPKKTRETTQMFNTARRFRLHSYVRLQTLDDLLQSLAVNGPCFVGLHWLKGWSNDDRTKLHVSDGSVSGGHAVCAVGFDRKSKLIRIRNQWGTSWGDKGYAWLTFDAFEKHGFDNYALFDMENPLLK